MRNKIMLILSALAVAVAFAVPASARVAGMGGGYTVPKVSYAEPKDQSTVDLTGKTVLTFKWNPVPAPAGGREAFRFKIYKGYSYDVVVSQEIDHRTFSVDIPSDKFVNGQKYTWRVQQRDGQTMSWSLYDTWSFTVKK